MTDKTGPENPPQTLPKPVEEQKRKPGQWVAETVKDAKERLGLNLLSFDPPAELVEAIKSKRNPKVKITYSESVASEICDLLLTGMPLAKICAMPNMPNYSTVYQWQEMHEEFRKRMEESKRVGSHYIADDCIRIADDESIDPAHKRIMVDTRLRLIKSWHSKAYGDNLKLAGDENGGPVRFFIDGLSDRAKAP